MALEQLASILYRRMEQMSPTPGAGPYTDLDAESKQYYRNCVKVIANNQALVDRYLNPQQPKEIAA